MRKARTKRPAVCKEETKERTFKGNFVKIVTDIARLNKLDGGVIEYLGWLPYIEKNWL